METKFTKGPCEVRSSEKAHEPGHFWHEIVVDKAVLGEVFEEGVDDDAEAALANAHLWASSPDLYERLTNARDQLIHLGAFPENACDEATVELIVLINTTLAHARGEQP